jgi:hypothetical protein
MESSEEGSGVTSINLFITVVRRTCIPAEVAGRLHRRNVCCRSWVGWLSFKDSAHRLRPGGFQQPAGVMSRELLRWLTRMLKRPPAQAASVNQALTSAVHPTFCSRGQIPQFPAAPRHSVSLKSGF